MIINLVYHLVWIFTSGQGATLLMVTAKSSWRRHISDTYPCIQTVSHVQMLVTAVWIKFTILQQSVIYVVLYDPNSNYDFDWSEKNTA